jgi:hypothetical protein
MSTSTIAAAGIGVQAAAATSAGGAVVYGAVLAFRSLFDVQIRPGDIEPWLQFIANTLWTAINGGILAYHLIGKARRDELKLWRASSRTRRKPRVPHG